MSYYQGGKSTAEKAIWNESCTLLRGLSWARERIRNDDYQGDADHPIDEPSANIASCIAILLKSPALAQRAEGDAKYDRLLNVIREAHDDLLVQDITTELVQGIIANIRTSGIFDGIPLDQEVPPYQEYTNRELYGRQ